MDSEAVPLGHLMLVGRRNIISWNGGCLTQPITRVGFQADVISERSRRMQQGKAAFADIMPRQPQASIDPLDTIVFMYVTYY